MALEWTQKNAGISVNCDSSDFMQRNMDVVLNFIWFVSYCFNSHRALTASFRSLVCKYHVGRGAALDFSSSAGTKQATNVLFTWVKETVAPYPEEIVTNFGSR